MIYNRTGKRLLESVLQVLAEGLLQVGVHGVVGRLADGEDDRGLGPVDEVADHLENLKVKACLQSLL